MSRSPMLRAGAVALALAGALTMSACSGGDKPAEKASSTSGGSQKAGQTFDFMAQSVPSTSGLTVLIPQKLKDAMGSEAGNLLVDSYQLSAHPLDGAEYCAFDVKPSWVNGGIAKLKQPTSEASSNAAGNVADIDANVEELTRRAEGMSGGKKGEQALVAFYGPVAQGKSRFLSDLSQGVSSRAGQVTAFINQKASSSTATTYAALVEELKTFMKDQGASRDASTNARPVYQVVGDAVTGVSQPKTMSQLTSSPTTTDTYVADDGSSLTVVTQCSESEFSDSRDEELYFRGTDGTVAKAYVTVMKNGTLTVRKGEVDGYKLDTTGNWIKD